MIVIRRLVDRQRAYTGIFLKGEPPRIFPTSDQEHARIMAIFKQDRAYEGILNDFSDYGIGSDILPAAVAPGESPAVPAAPKPFSARGGSSLWITLPDDSARVKRSPENFRL